MNTVVNLTITQGANFDVLVQLKDNTGAVANMVGYQGLLEGKSNGVTVVTFSTADGSMVMQADGVRLKMDALDTMALDFSDCVYDCKLTKIDGTIFRIPRGTIVLIPAVTD